MKTYQDLKTAKFLEAMIDYAKSRLDCRFKPSGKNRYTAHCPFHADRKDSFRLYVDANDVVRFHCFGECKGDWDIYDVIKLRENCSFREAQQTWASYLGIEGVEFHRGKNQPVPEPEREPEPNVGVEFIEPAEPDDQIKAALGEAAAFYNELLLSDPEKYSKILAYLERRGVDRTLVESFQIGYCPKYEDEEHRGRALIDAFLPRFVEDYRVFHLFSRASLVRLLNVETEKGRLSYYQQQIDFGRSDPFSRTYGDYFAGRIVFPIRNPESHVVGFIGRRPDNRGVRWLKQQSEDGSISTRSWLYGMDKAFRSVKNYRTVILVEGVFDYFAFYRILQDQDKPVVVSTLGSHLSAEAANVFKNLEVEHFIVAYDWDNAGKKGLMRIASEVGGIVHYLGGMKAGQDPFDKLKGVVGSIGGFSLRHLAASAKKTQPGTERPVHISFVSCGPQAKREVVFSPFRADEPLTFSEKSEATEYFYDIDDFMPLLSYDHGNKAMLQETLSRIESLLESRPEKPASDRVFTIPVKFLQAETYTDLGPAIILWLRLVIEQQSRKRRIRQTDAVLAEWLNTSRVTVARYKQALNKLGYLNIDTSTRPQRLSVYYFPKS